MTQRACVKPLGALWTVKSDARQVITAYDTQAEASAAARALLRGTGGGELFLGDTDGNVFHHESVQRGAV
jgi:hypothetical protein